MSAHVSLDFVESLSLTELTLMLAFIDPQHSAATVTSRKFYSDFNTVFSLCLSCWLLLVYGSCCLFLMRKIFHC